MVWRGSLASRDTLIAEQEQDPILSPLKEMPLLSEEIENMAEGFYLKDEEVETPKLTCH